MGMSEIERKLLKGGTPVPASNEPLAVRLDQAVQISGFSRSDLYRRAARGEIVFLKCGARILVEYQSLKGAVAALPVADIRVAT
jgi:hypothetical protein